MTTITANIPARTITWGGKKKTYPARVETFTQDERGAWMMGDVAMTEAEVVDVCQDATNWSAIKSAHFPMVGFHS